MKNKNLLLIASLCGVAVLMGGCATCPTQTHSEKPEYAHKKHHSKKSGPVVFQQTYSGSDVKNVRANMYTRSSRGGESAMGTVKFHETDAGLQMNVDLIDLRPGKVYTAQIYQCGACNDSVCCDTEAMAIDLPTLKIDNVGRLQESYIIRGLSASQLDNAKFILTRDGGYKAAWGTLNQ